MKNKIYESLTQAIFMNGFSIIPIKEISLDTVSFNEHYLTTGYLLNDTFDKIQVTAIHIEPDKITQNDPLYTKCFRKEKHILESANLDKVYERLYGYSSITLKDAVIKEIYETSDENKKTNIEKSLINSVVYIKQHNKKNNLDVEISFDKENNFYFDLLKSKNEYFLAFNKNEHAISYAVGGSLLLNKSAKCEFIYYFNSKKYELKYEDKSEKNKHELNFIFSLDDYISNTLYICKDKKTNFNIDLSSYRTYKEGLEFINLTQDIQIDMRVFDLFKNVFDNNIVYNQFKDFLDKPKSFDIENIEKFIEKKYVNLTFMESRIKKYFDINIQTPKIK